MRIVSFCHDFYWCHCSALCRARVHRKHRKWLFYYYKFYNKFSVIIITILTLVEAKILYFYFLFTLYIVCYYHRTGERARRRRMSTTIDYWSRYQRVLFPHSKFKESNAVTVVARQRRVFLAILRCVTLFWSDRQASATFMRLMRSVIFDADADTPATTTTTTEHEYRGQRRPCDVQTLYSTLNGRNAFCFCIVAPFRFY